MPARGGILIGSILTLIRQDFSIERTLGSELAAASNAGSVLQQFVGGKHIGLQPRGADDDVQNQRVTSETPREPPVSNAQMPPGPKISITRAIIAPLTSVKLQATLTAVKIRNIAHKGLKRLYAEDNAKGVPADTVDKLCKMLAFLDDMQDPEELRALPSWKVHTLTGDRKGTWSLSVTRNRRLTFRIDTAEREICDLDLEDYH